MSRRLLGPFVTVLMFAGVAVVLIANSQAPPKSTTSTPPAPGIGTGTAAAGVGAAPGSVKPAGFREYPIGDTVANHLSIAAVWLPSVQMDLDAPRTDGPDLIHLEADVRATGGNPNGFAKEEFVPYLKIRYAIAPAAGGPPIQRGELVPMVASDGLHYGASVDMPKAGSFQLTYAIEPPSAGGLGRHHDPVTGVAPWWSPFEVAFDWDYDGPPAAPSGPGG